MSTDRFAAFLTHLGREGIELRVVDGRVQWCPIDKVGSELEQWFRNYERELVGLLFPVPRKRTGRTTSNIVPIHGAAVWAAEYAFHERLGIADELGHETREGSSDWLIAIGEAMQAEYILLNESRETRVNHHHD